MKTVPLITGAVGPSGKLLFTMDERSQLDTWLRTLMGKRVDITIKEHRATRSNEQNAWIWGVAYPLLAETLGYDRDEHDDLHYALVEKWGGSHLDERIGIEVPNKRSSKLTTTEFSDYMEWLVRFAAKEFNCVIPLPDEAAA